MAPEDPLAEPALTESERLALAAMPLPKLPNLAVREAAPPPPAPEVPPRPAPVAAERPQPAAPAAAAVPGSDDAVALLRRASERTGLGDLELARIARYEAMLRRGERDAAIEGLALLNAEFDRTMRSATVGAGENLRAVAGRPEVYGNAAMWPLIWRANLAALPEPWQVARDQTLAVPSFPALADVAEAIAYAQEHARDVVRPDAR